MLQGLDFPLEAAEISIGRAASNHLPVEDSMLSRAHCVIRDIDGEFVLRDVGSRNGTLVNGVPVEEHVLCHGDEITLGRSSVRFLSSAEPIAMRGNRAELADEEPLPGTETLLSAVSAENSSTSVASAVHDRRFKALDSLLTIARGIGGIRDRESLAWQIVGMVFDVVPAERAAMLFLDQDPEHFSAALAWDRLRGPGHAVRISRTLMHQVANGRRGILLRDVQHSPIAQSAALADFFADSLICVPVICDDKLAAVIYVDTSDPKHPFDAAHLEIATAIASLVSLALVNISRMDALTVENHDLRSRIAVAHELVGTGPKMQAVLEFVRRVAPTDSTVLIEGESGTGKELVARAIHQSSGRASGPFIAVNCAAIAETLLESEMFGHERGAFTGAVALRKGKFELASSGTLFLDEIGELAPALQAKLLRVLQEREFERVGGTRPIKTDVRVIAATNRNLQELSTTGAFRRDLYYRLNVVSIHLPILRERHEDIELLAKRFIASAARKCKMPVKRISPEAMHCLLAYDWPGNVRELENAMERALVLGVADAIVPDDLPEAILEAATSESSAPAKFATALKQSKKEVILAALAQAHGNYAEAANMLGIHPNSLPRLIRRLGIKEEAKRVGM